MWGTLPLPHTLACTQFLRQCTGRLWNFLQQHVNAKNFRKWPQTPFLMGRWLNTERVCHKIVCSLSWQTIKTGCGPEQSAAAELALRGRIPRSPTIPSDLLAGYETKKYLYDKKPLKPEFLEAMKLCPTVCPAVYHCLYWFLSQGWFWPPSQRMLSWADHWSDPAWISCMC